MSVLLQIAVLVISGTDSSCECLCNADTHRGLSEQLTNYSTSQVAKKAECYRSSELTPVVITRVCLQPPWEESVPHLWDRSPQLPTPLTGASEGQTWGKCFLELSPTDPAVISHHFHMK